MKLKKIIAAVSAAAIVIGCMPQVTAVDFGRLNGEFVSINYKKSIITNNENEDLYVSDGVTTRSRDFMTDSELEIYDNLKAEIQKITLEESTNTDIEFEISTPIEDDSEMGNAIVNAAEYLMRDYPEYLCWCAGYGYSYYSSTKVNVCFMLKRNIRQMILR